MTARRINEYLIIFTVGFTVKNIKIDNTKNTRLAYEKNIIKKHNFMYTIIIDIKLTNINILSKHNYVQRSAETKK